MKGVKIISIGIMAIENKINVFWDWLNNKIASIKSEIITGIIKNPAPGKYKAITRLISIQINSGAIIKSWAVRFLKKPL